MFSAACIYAKTKKALGKRDLGVLGLCVVLINNVVYAVLCIVTVQFI